jgi:hypothetical protein
MRSCLDRLRSQGNTVAVCQVGHEVVPLSADQDASKVEDQLGAFAAPTHSRPLELNAESVRGAWNALGVWG